MSPIRKIRIPKIIQEFEGYLSDLKPFWYSKYSNSIGFSDYCELYFLFKIMKTQENEVQKDNKKS